MRSSGTPDEFPEILRLAAHPVRWRLLKALTHSDRTVRELVLLTGEPQSLVSYHLRLLREGGLVTSCRSSADGRDSYYAIDLAACRDGLLLAGDALHQTLLEPTSRPLATHAQRTPRLFFLCTGNSARSQIAEALVLQMSGGRVHADSAGSHPKPLHPNAVRVLQRRGIDISQNRSKHLDEFRSVRFDTVITLCDRVREVCPPFAAQPRLVHWSIPDPAREGSNDQESYPAFERTVDQLEARLSFQIPLLATSPDTSTRRSPTHVR
jgi:protein-tyrosine-phosphatase/DNA-binding transcriptional ArsR family regulator